MEIALSIGYLAIELLVVFVFKKCNAEHILTDKDIFLFGLFWPITLTIIILFGIPVLIYDFIALICIVIKDIVLNFVKKFSKNAKIQHKIDSRKFVEDILTEVNNEH